MSKAQLKKELAHLDRDQLVEVILNAYSSSKESKEYFEFFLNPDLEALMQKKVDIIAKELNRAKYGYSKARISFIRKAISDFAAFGVGDEHVYTLTHCALRMLVGMERYYHFSETLTKGTLRLTGDFIALADRLECIDDALGKLKRMGEEDLGRANFRAKVDTAARDAIKELSTKKHR